jgi:Helix-turn-helix domain of transposase family ISL3
MDAVGWWSRRLLARTAARTAVYSAAGCISGPGSGSGTFRSPARPGSSTWSWSGVGSSATSRRAHGRTFAQVTQQVPGRARVTTRLRGLVLEAVVVGGRAVSAVAAEHALGWWTVMSQVCLAGLLLADPDTVPVRRLGIDERRYRSTRFYREPDGTWRRSNHG